MRGHGAGHLEGADDVHSVDPVEVVCIETFEVRVGDELCGTGVVDEAIDASPAVECCGGHAAAIFVLRNVGLDEQGLDAVGAAFGLRVARFLLALRVIDDDVAALGGEHLRCRRSNARC